VTAAEAPRAGYGEALRSREFRALFAGQAISIAGTSIAAVALTVLVYRRTGSPFLSSLTFALGFLPYLLGGGLLSGLVDRVRPRSLVAGSSAISAVLALLMAWPRMPVPALLALLFCLGLTSSVAGGGFGALTRSSVPDAVYVPARSLLKIASQSAQIGGNAVGGALLVALGTSGAILVNAGSFAVALALLLLFVRDHPNLAGAPRARLLVDSLRGVHDVLGRPELARLMLLGWLVPMFSVAPEALAAPYVAGRHASAALVGWWLAALPVGTIAGDIAGVRWLAPGTQRRIVTAVAAASFVPYLVFFAEPPVAVSLALLVVSGLFGFYSLGLDGRLRDAAPEGLFARMMALNSAGLMTLQGLGFALAGAVAEAVGSGRAIALAGICGLAVTALLRLGKRSSAPAGTSAEVRNLST
jgi:predicted MFS family arabinose efflux permease